LQARNHPPIDVVCHSRPAQRWPRSDHAWTRAQSPAAQPWPSSDQAPRLPPGRTTQRNRASEISVWAGSCLQTLRKRTKTLFHA
jgi:hypothetical protein